MEFRAVIFAEMITKLNSPQNKAAVCNLKSRMVPSKMPFCVIYLAAQCEIPPLHRARPFRDSIAEGGIAPICLVFRGYRASIAEIPLLGGGGLAPPLRMLSTGETLRKGEGVSHPIGHVETPNSP